MANDDIRVKISAKDEASVVLGDLIKRLKQAGLPTKGLSRDLAGLNRETNSLSRFSRGFALPRMVQGLRGMRREADEMRKGLTRLGEGMGTLGELGGIAGLGVGAGLLGATLLTKRWADFGMTTSIAARNIGLTTGQLYRYQRAASLAGVSGDAVTQSLQGFASGLWRARINQDPQMVQALRALGIHAGIAHGKLKPIGALLPQIADKIRAIHSGPAQMQVANALGLGSMLPFLRMGGPWIRSHLAQLQKEGVGENFGGFRAIYDDFSKLDTASRHLANQFAQHFAPTLNRATTALVHWMNALPNTIDSGERTVGGWWNSFSTWWNNLSGHKPGSGNVLRQGTARSLRDNNPLNLSYVQGQVGLSGRDGQFGKFRSMSYGIAAATNQLLIDRSRGMDTVRSLVSSWAPPGSNDTAAYIRNVSKWMGVKPDQKLNLRDPGVMGALVDAMARQEGSGKLSASDTMAGVKMGYGEFARGMARNGGGVGGRVVVDINHRNAPPGVSVDAHSTDSSVVVGSLRISRAHPGEALP